MADFIVLKQAHSTTAFSAAAGLDVIVTVEELHQLPGHASLDSTKCMVKDHVVEGAILDESAPVDSSEYGKKDSQTYQKAERDEARE